MGYGFKAGLNFSNFQGPSELGPDGSELETNELITGFHIGAIINFKFAELAGLRTELMFSQKGSRYNYDGPSFQHFQIVNQNNVLETTGTKKISLNITNAYIDIPVMGYFRATDWLEVSGGASIGFLVSSIAAGDLSYSGATAGGALVEDILIGLDYNYTTDDELVLNPDDATTATIGGQTITIPRTVGSYFDQSLYGGSFDGNLFNTIDLGLVGGINIFLNQGLSLGLRANYGLSDITRNESDHYRQELGPDRQLITSTDKDVNFSIQTSIGFSF